MTNDKDLEGTYNFQLLGSLNPFMNKTHDIRLVMKVYRYPNTQAPFFKSTVKPIITVYLLEETKISLPIAEDPEEDPFTISLVSLSQATIDPATDFTILDRDQNCLIIKPIEETHLGIHTLGIVLKDEHPWEPLSRLVKITLIVVKREEIISNGFGVPIEQDDIKNFNKSLKPIEIIKKSFTFSIREISS